LVHPTILRITGTAFLMFYALVITYLPSMLINETVSDGGSITWIEFFDVKGLNIRVHAVTVLNSGSLVIAGEIAGGVPPPTLIVGAVVVIIVVIAVILLKPRK